MICTPRLAPCHTATSTATISSPQTIESNKLIGLYNKHKDKLVHTAEFKVIEESFYTRIK